MEDKKTGKSLGGGGEGGGGSSSGSSGDGGGTSSSSSLSGGETKESSWGSVLSVSSFTSLWLCGEETKTTSVHHVSISKAYEITFLLVILLLLLAFLLRNTLLVGAL